ncbi:hypothetical protein EXD82_08955 [Peptacetobacter hominis]|uniref:Uncharacterized protein n=1 Tax=Peptacetobacter hominis TaxID=2743610 RepID=A0A544QTK2_9FIRM|nr:hypothetical protein [Peptacetobacter hominis]TQQ84016.1 hypothetical protein EXD82_08955 [Peptacetobacter hominis]
MSGKSSFNTKFYVVVGLTVFIVLYLIGFFIIGGRMNKNDEDETDNTIQVEENNSQNEEYSLLSKLESSSDIYLSTEGGDDIKLEKERWEEMEYYFDEMVKIRGAESYKPVVSGHTSSGIKFSTDFEFLRIYNVEKEEYYKIPVSKKEEFKGIVNGAIYTSFDFVMNEANWKKLYISKGEDVKTIHGWKYKEVSEKIRYKRLVGKIQPEKAKERTDVNYVMVIEGEGFEAKVETMGPDYIKITSNDCVAYYEIYEDFYNYLTDDIFS